MKNFYEVGKVYVWQGQRGCYACLNGTETTVISDADIIEDAFDGRVVPGQLTDTPSPNIEGNTMFAEPGDLRPKNPPSGERSTLALFKLPHLEPA